MLVFIPFTYCMAVSEFKQGWTWRRIFAWNMQMRWQKCFFFQKWLLLHVARNFRRPEKGHGIAKHVFVRRKHAALSIGNWALFSIITRLNLSRCWVLTSTRWRPCDARVVTSTVIKLRVTCKAFASTRGCWKSHPGGGLRTNKRCRFTR